MVSCERRLLLSYRFAASLRCLSWRRDTCLPTEARAGVVLTGVTILGAGLAVKSRSGAAASAFGKLSGDAGADAGVDPDAPPTYTGDDAALGASTAAWLSAVALETTAASNE